jgi:hypothetical protein
LRNDKQVFEVLFRKFLLLVTGDLYPTVLTVPYSSEIIYAYTSLLVGMHEKPEIISAIIANLFAIVTADKIADTPFWFMQACSMVVEFTPSHVGYFSSPEVIQALDLFLERWGEQLISFPPAVSSLKFLLVPPLKRIFSLQDPALVQRRMTVICDVLSFSIEKKSLISTKEFLDVCIVIKKIKDCAILHKKELAGLCDQIMEKMEELYGKLDSRALDTCGISLEQIEEDETRRQEVQSSHNDRIRRLCRTTQAQAQVLFR